jgi:hypothetical protein
MLPEQATPWEYGPMGAAAASAEKGRIVCVLMVVQELIMSALSAVTVMDTTGFISGLPCLD